MLNSQFVDSVIIIEEGAEQEGRQKTTQVSIGGLTLNDLRRLKIINLSLSDQRGQQSYLIIRRIIKPSTTPILVVTLKH